MNNLRQWWRKQKLQIAWKYYHKANQSVVQWSKIIWKLQDEEISFLKREQLERLAKEALHKS